MLDVNWILLDSDLTCFPASHAIWDDHGPKAARSEPLFDLLPKGPTRTGLTPGDFSVIPVQTQCHRVFKFDRPGPCPRRAKSFHGPHRTVCIGRYVCNDSASAVIQASRDRRPTSV